MMFVFELGMLAQVAPRIPCPRARTGMLSLGSNPGHKATKKRAQPSDDMGSSTRTIHIAVTRVTGGCESPC